MMHILKVSVLLILLAGCSTVAGLGLKALTGGGGPQLNVDAQIGKTNTKQIVGQQTNAGRDVVTSSVRADKVDTVVVNEGVKISWFTLSVIIGLIGWWLPTPRVIGQSIRRLLFRV